MRFNWINLNGAMFVLYGLAFVPAVLFLLNGILLRHPALIAAALVFGVFHFLIVKENMKSSTKLSLPRSESERKIVKERIEDGANEKAILAFPATALSFASISIFPG